MLFGGWLNRRDLASHFHISTSPKTLHAHIHQDNLGSDICTSHAAAGVPCTVSKMRSIASHVPRMCSSQSASGPSVFSKKMKLSTCSLIKLC